MKRDLYRVIRSIRDQERGIKPDPAWVRATRETLLMQVKNTIPSAEAAAKNRVLAKPVSRLMQAVRGPVLAVSTIVIALLGGSLVSVSAAERSLPGDSLYALKLVTEQARLALTREQAERMRLKLEFTKRRVEELRTIATTDVSKKDERAAKAAEILKQDLNTLKQQLDEAKTSGNTKELADAARVVEKESVEVVKSLTESKKDFTSDVKQTVTDAQASAADIGIKALQVLVDVKGDPQGNVTDADIGASVAMHAEVTKGVAATTMQLAERSGIVSVSSTAATTTSTTALAKDIESMLLEAQRLLGDNRTLEALEKLKEASLQSFLAQKLLEGAQTVPAQSTGSASSTEQGTSNGSSSSTSGTTSSTGGVSAPGT